MNSNQDNNRNPAGNSSRLSCLYGGITVLSATWTILAPWFTARNLVSVAFERRSCWVAILAVIVFGIKYARMRASGASIPSGILRWCFFLCALLAAFCGEVFSNNLFVFWKVRAIPPDVWAQMASDLQKIGEASANNNNRSFRPHELPESLHQLGRTADYAYGNGQWVSLSKDSGARDLAADLEFGNGLRAWGLFVASNKITQDHFEAVCIRTINVAPGALFYLRPTGH